MSRRDADYDEFCDVKKPKPIKLDRVLDAADRLRKYIVYTPCAASHCQEEFAIRLYYKLENQHHTGSCKERGIVNALLCLTPTQKQIGVVMASLGNSAIALSYYGAKFQIPVIVVLPHSVPISIQQRCHSNGARVIVQGQFLADSQRHARMIGRNTGYTYINNRDYPDLLDGYGTIALEILEQVQKVQAIIVPVGCGGLAAGIASVIKRIKPKCLVYGVQAEVMPAFFKSLKSSEIESTQLKPTMANNLAVTHIGVNAFFNGHQYLDRMLLVNEDWICRSMLHLVENEHFVVEGAGACSLAAIIGELVPELRLKTHSKLVLIRRVMIGYGEMWQSLISSSPLFHSVVCVLSGGNVDNYVFSRCLERGMAGEGRLIKFRVGIKDSSFAQSQLMKLIKNGEYNVVEQFQEHRWVEGDDYLMEMRIVVETKGLEHALQLKDLIERAYPLTTTFENNPFKDKRCCACFVRNSMRPYPEESDLSKL